MDLVNVFSKCEDVTDPDSWCDLVFDVVNVDLQKVGFFKRTPKNISLNAKAVAEEGKIVGFSIDLPLTDWVTQDHEAGMTLYWGALRLRSLGDISDSLLRLYQNKFQMPANEGQSAAEEMNCKAVFLEGSPEQILSSPAKLKLFFGDDSVADAPSYGELYLNIDLSNRRVTLNEKDPEYRKPLVAWFSGL